MGVDIGAVRSVGQIGPPWSVASLKQRLGRSGRKEGEPQIVRLYVRCRRPAADADLFDRLHLDLVQSIAVTELMLANWVEPAVPPKWDLSTLTQQIISVLAQTGGVGAQALYEHLCVRGAFHEVDRKMFATLLRQLTTKDVVEQMEGGDLILGLRGEQIRRDRGFYAVFPTPEKYAVLHEGRSLGTLECAHETGEHLLFAGRRWLIADADHERLELHVVSAYGFKRPKFNRGAGEVHARVREKMRDVLLASERYVYLTTEGHEILYAARRTAAESQLFDKLFVPLGPRSIAVLTWTGTRCQRTMQLRLAAAGVTALDEGIGFTCSGTMEEIRSACRPAAALSDIVIEHNDLMSLAKRKYDWLLGDPLLKTSYELGWLDVAASAAALRKLNAGA
jgi:ATP-dependent Lhr-like helicase